MSDEIHFAGPGQWYARAAQTKTARRAPRATTGGRPAPSGEILEPIEGPQTPSGASDIDRS